MNESPLQQSEWSIWWRWVVATCIGAGISVLIILIAGTIVAATRGEILGSFDSTLIVGSIFVGIVAAIMARAQQWAFGSYVAFEDYEVAAWWFVSGVGALVTMLVVAFLTQGDRPWWRLQDLALSTSYYGIVTVFGAGLGTAQWLVLRRIGAGTGWWVLWNVAAAALICVVPLLTDSWLWGTIIGVVIYAAITATAVLWLHFALGQRNAEQRASRMSNTSDQMTVLLISSAVVCFLLVGVCAISSLMQGGIPDYPRADSTTVETISPRDSGFGRDITRFASDDAPKDVLLFYRNALPNRGWSYNGTVIAPESGWHSLSFRDSNSCGLTVTITATVGLDGRTVGEIDRAMHPCY